MGVVSERSISVMRERKLYSCVCTQKRLNVRSEVRVTVERWLTVMGTRVGIEGGVMCVLVWLAQILQLGNRECRTCRICRKPRCDG